MSQHPFEQYWDQFEDTTKRVFSLAHLHSREQGGGGRIRTRYLFGALRSLQHEDLNRLLQEIPEDALPDPVSVEQEVTVIDLDRITPPLSPCVRSSVESLGELNEQSESITPLDLFVDLARHGGGSTVSTMRSHGISPERINELLTSHGLQARDRHGLCG